MKNTPRWYRLNHLGDVVALADRAGKSVELAAAARYASYYDSVGRPNCCYAFAKRKTTHDQYVVYQQTEKLPLQPIVSGHYEHAFERVEGAWRIASHRFFVDQVGDVSQHLLVEIS